MTTTGGDPHLEQRLAGPIDRQALAELLVDLEQSGRANPSVARGLVDRSTRLATERGWPDLAARATYLHAQLCALDGRADAAAEELETARQQFVALGMKDEAERTILGQAHVEMIRGRADRAIAGLTALIEEHVRRGRDDPSALEARARQNLGAVLINQGDLDDAIAHFQVARSIATHLGDTDLVLEVTNNEAMALLRLGRAAEAIRLASEALTTAGAPDHFVDAQVRDTLGRAQLVAGEFAAALDNLQLSLTTFEHLGLRGEVSRARIALGDALLTCNLTVEAHCAYQQALDESDADSDVLGWAALGAAQTSLELQEPSRALELAETARATFSRDGAAVGLSLAHLTIARIAQERGNLTDALALGELALTLARSADLPVETALAELFLHGIDEDEERLQRTGRILDTADIPSLRAAWHTRCGEHHLARNDHARAAASFRAAIAAVEHQRGSIAGERHRRMFMAGRTAPYDALQELLVRQATEDSILEAFTLGELLRARELQDALAGEVPRSGRADHPDALDELARATLRLGAEGILCGDPEAIPDTERKRFTGRPADATAGLRALQRALGTDTTYVSYARLGRGLQAFVVDASSLRQVTLLESLDELGPALRELDAQMARMQSSAFAERWADELVSSVNTTLGRLHAILVAPLGIASEPDPPTSIVISPSAELNGVPFAALRAGDRDLIDDYTISMAPSARAWLSCRAGIPATGLSKVFALATSRLPQIRLEAVEVAAALDGRADLVMTERASRQHALGMRRPAVAHFACHGRFRPRQPMMSTLRLADGDLTAHEFASTDLAGSLVVLSACESGRGTAIAGPEVLGFERAAFMAGARVAVTSRWLVEDGSARSIMSRFHHEVAAGSPPAMALRTAQLALRASHPHPYHWAAFSCAGAGFEPHTGPRPSRALVS